jgi:hypothetical protein
MFASSALPCNRTSDLLAFVTLHTLPPDCLRFVFLTAVMLLTCIAGCTGGEPGPADGGDASGDGGAIETVIQIGGADKYGKQFIDLSGGGVKAPILRGPQGGQHIWLMVRFQGVDLSPKKLRIAATMRIRDTQVVVKPGTVTVTQTLRDKKGWFQLSTAIPAFVKCPCQVYGKQLDVEAAVIDLYGRTAIAKETITGTWDGVCTGATPGSCKAQ